MCLFQENDYRRGQIADASQVCRRMLELKDKCIHPTSQKPYIKAFSGGKNNSPEGQAVCLSLETIPDLFNTC